MSTLERAVAFAPRGPFSPDQIIGHKYVLKRRIGVGGMGEVWEARHMELEASVAIKFALDRGAIEPMLLERFRREACVLARLDSPEIVRVFDAGQHGAHPYLVMELLQGETLRARLERDGLLPLEIVGALAFQVARALAVIHRAGLVHRDVTPGNLFLLSPTAEFPDLRVKVLDFGIAKTVAGDSRITTSGAIIGSPAYMSPEQARCEVVDAASDLWSLAAVLYRCVSGSDVFAGPSVADVLFRICTGEVPPVAKANPALPDELDAFFERAFARNRQFRFETAMDMASAFCAVIDSPTSSAARELPLPVREPHSMRAWIRDADTASIVQSANAKRERGVKLLHYSWIVAVSASLGAATSHLLVPALVSLAVTPDASAVSIRVPQPQATPQRSQPVTNHALGSELRVATATTPALASTSDSVPVASTAATPSAPKSRLASPVRAAPAQAASKKHEPAPVTDSVLATAKVDPLFGLPVITKGAELNRTVPSSGSGNRVK
ncbi:MAG TPA: protein kinase [Polyangiaceae bacterium]